MTAPRTEDVISAFKEAKAWALLAASLLTEPETCVHACVRVCVRMVCKRVYACACVCVCVCMRVRLNACVRALVGVYACMCVFVSVFVCLNSQRAKATQNSDVHSMRAYAKRFSSSHNHAKPTKQSQSSASTQTCAAFPPSILASSTAHSIDRSAHHQNRNSTAILTHQVMPSVLPS